MSSGVEFSLNGAAVDVAPEGSLLDALREQLGVRSAKDGCSPQGQCGCCTVWVDGQARVACVTPVGRVRGRAVTTVEGLPDAAEWAEAFASYGASQCGFCTPGIIMRAAALPPERRGEPVAVGQALLAHLCRCTGWQPITEAIRSVGVAHPTARRGVPTLGGPAERRAELEGGVAQSVGPQIALGQGGFADDRAPADALVAVLAADGEWVVGETLAEARRLSGKVQGRRTTAPVAWPIDVPAGEWARTLQTTWVEPAYLEPDAAWCVPGGAPFSSHGNGGAFGGKQTGAVERAARQLADRYGRPVRALYTREDVVRRGPKRPPLAAGIRADGTGAVRIARTAGLADAVAMLAGAFEVTEVDIAGPPTSLDLRGAVWAELAVLRASLQPGPAFTVTARSGGTATASIDTDGTIRISIDAGEPLDPVVLRSYCTGAAHMALGWVTSEGLAVDSEGVPRDLTIRSFGVLRAVDVPPIEVTIDPSDGEPVAVSEAVLAAVATAAWRRAEWHGKWPTGAV